jgi:hypothetical protein
MTNPSTHTVTNIQVGLPTDDAFIITSSIPDSLQGGQNVTVTVAFNPSAKGEVKGSVTAMFANHPDSSTTLYLRGIGKVVDPGTVYPDGLAEFAVKVHPNPFSGSATIDVNYDGREGLEVRLVDILGREYDLLGSDMMRTMQLDKNAWEQLKVDRTQMQLASGNYTLFVKNGERILTRQVILIQE